MTCGRLWYAQGYATRRTTKQPPYAKKSCSRNIYHFMFKHRHKLDSFIDDIWTWESVDDILAVARRPRLEALEVARRSACVCGGRWLEVV